MRRLVVALVVVGVVLVGCGSEGEQRATGTATSERVERQVTVSEQQEQASDVREAAQEEEEESVALQAAQEEAVSEEQSEEEQVAAAVEADEEEGEEEDEEEQVVELPAEIIGVHKGVRSERHVLGEPDAPVEIRYYGDFT